MSDVLPQAAETTPLGTPVPASDGAPGSASADYETWEARENALAIGAEPKPAAQPEPEPEPVAEAAPDKSVTPPSPTSKRTERRVQRDQDQINETIRRAVQDATDATERRLRAELAKPAEAKAEPEAAPIVDPKDPEPLEADFDDYRTFVKATAKWEIRQAKREADAAERVTAETAQRETAQRDDFHARATTWIGRRDTFLAANPAKSDAMMAFLETLHAGTPIGDVILDSDVGAEVADYLASNPTESERIARLAPIAALRALGKLEARFDPDNTTSASATAAGPAAKTVTSAPAPPTTLASRSATPADPAAAAFARGDYPAWEAEENRKAISANR